MLDIFRKKNKDNSKDQKTGKPIVNKSVKEDAKTLFGGMSSAQIIKQIQSKNDNPFQQNSGVLKSTSPKINNNEVQHNSSNNHQSNLKISNETGLAEEIATTYSEGETKSAIDLLEQYLNKHKGIVDKKFWFMLMDIYQSNAEKQKFEQLGIRFAHIFSCSPPSWVQQQNESRVVVGKNVLLLPSNLTAIDATKTKEFIKAGREEKFARIDVSKIKLESSDSLGLENLLKIMYELKKFRVVTILMGENHLINLCKIYIKDSPENKHIILEKFLPHEQLFWLIYLEMLQWRGKTEEFEDLSLEYAMKFELSSPGWEDSGCMKIKDTIKNNEQLDDDEIKLEKNLNSNNITTFFDIIEKSTEQQKIEISFTNVDRIDFSSAGSITHYLQELQQKQKSSVKKIILKEPNELIITLLEMVGATEFLEIKPKIR